MGESKELVLWFKDISKKDVSLVGGKTANLGEMINRTRVPVPNGFATTSYSYNYFISKNKLWPKIKKELDKIKDPNDTLRLRRIGATIREYIIKANIPKDLERAIITAYKKLGSGMVAVRSSATAEDLPGASFAGQQETFLNVTGNKEVVQKVKECYASLFTNRAIFYRIQKGFSHEKVALSVVVQKMIDAKAAGVLFTLDVTTGNKDVIIIEGSYGLGEYVVQGKITPDDFYVRKKDLKIIEKKISDKQIMLVSTRHGNLEEKVPLKLRKKAVLTDTQIKKLAKYGIELEKHYKHAQDVEWAIDKKGKLFILQTRPETVWSEKQKKIKRIKGKRVKEIIRGLSASPGAASGRVKIVEDLSELKKVRKGDVLVTRMTNPDMVVAMKKAAAIVTDEGGVTSHASIVSRELGIPCVVGTEHATKWLKENSRVTVDGSLGAVFEGIVKIKKEKKFKGKVPKTRTKVYVNLSVPELANDIAKKPSDGVGLLREEFIIANEIREHPLYMLKTKRGAEFVEKLSKEIMKVAKAFYPRPVILRLSDLKTNEYRSLKGGEIEPKEENPMIGWRGCSRYISKTYEKAFRLELKAVRKVRQKYKNVWIMLPFVRNIKEVRKINLILKQEHLSRSKDLKLWLMAEVPSNIFLADQFSKYCDGFSIGSNDLTQLILGVDRDSKILGKMGEFDEENEAVKRAISHLIKTAHMYGKTVSICGQAPSNKPKFAEFLVEQGIDSISVNPDVIEKTRFIIAKCEIELKRGK